MLSKEPSTRAAASHGQDANEAAHQIAFEVDETSEEVSECDTDTVRGRKVVAIKASSLALGSGSESDPLVLRQSAGPLSESVSGLRSTLSGYGATARAGADLVSATGSLRIQQRKRTGAARVGRALFFLLVCAWILALLAGFDGDSSPSKPPVVRPVPVPAKNVTYTQRAFYINGEPELFFTATIHYPRSDPAIWPDLLARAKAGGCNAVDTYVFWNLHEPKEGVYDFETGFANLPLFLKLAQEAGLQIVLRIGPYVCAEWNYGGFPTWLLEKPAMAGFVKKTLEVVDPYLGTQGGPIVLLQVENEFGNIAKEMGPDGYRYIQWAGEFAQSLNDNVPTVINSANGFYADNWIEGHRKRFPDQPAMFTELWTGWFQKFGEGKYTRYAEDVAFASARFVARGGTYVAYYMYHGGTNFGRWGSDWKTTSYDYDAPLNESPDGFPNNPKYSHLRDLHDVLNDQKTLLLRNDPQHTRLNDAGAEAHVYGDLFEKALVFLSNPDRNRDATVRFDGREFSLPHWSVGVYLKDSNGLHLLYSTMSVKPAVAIIPERERVPIGPILPRYLYSRDNTTSLPILASTAAQRAALKQLSLKRSDPTTTDLFLRALPDAISHIREPVGIWNNATALRAPRPLEQLRVTHDASDYLWYVRRGVRLRDESKVRVAFPDGVADVAHIFLDGTRVHDHAFIAEKGAGSAVNVDVDLADRKKKHKKRPVPSPSPSPPPPMEGPGRDDGSDHELAVLVAVAGLQNCCGHLETLRKGIQGGVIVDKVDVAKGEWVHQVGLKGEHLEYARGSRVRNAWEPTFTKGVRNVAGPLVWYLIKFSMHELLAMHSVALDTQVQAQSLGLNADLIPGVRPMTAFVLHLGSMSRGLAFVNGHAVGRHWSRVAQCDDVPCRYPDSRSDGAGERCAIGCGYASQSWYNVPTSWILEDEFDEIEVVVFDEEGGDPLGVRIGVISG
ncbi:glycosyl hydrolases family 35-domain-containing protein [Chytriomyces sp. MP71]|nr:glycosyl hydrolases family 35-domain-containing protein [Chytriomyces sp. MP71]